MTCVQTNSSQAASHVKGNKYVVHLSLFWNPTHTWHLFDLGHFLHACCMPIDGGHILYMCIYVPLCCEATAGFLSATERTAPRKCAHHMYNWGWFMSARKITCCLVMLKSAEHS